MPRSSAAPVSLRVALVAFVTAAAVLVVLPAPARSEELCDGLEVTIPGATDGDDVLIGTSGPDVIAGLGGDDTINGLGGNDIICGGDGDDTINGGWGTDRIFGEGGHDTINGDGWADYIEGGPGRDVIDGGNGGDTVFGGGWADTISGGAGSDDLRGGVGSDTLDGGGGNDVLWGGAGNDELLGGAGADDLRGHDGSDTLHGLAGNDHVNGGNGDDVLRGGMGDDDIWGGAGSDRAFGNRGNDSIRGGQHDDLLFGGPDDDVISGYAGTDSANGGDGADDCLAETETNCEAGLIDFAVERFLINQAVPAADSADSPGDRIEPVVGRAGVVRGFFSANRFDTDYKPTVRLHWKKVGGETGAIVLDGPAALWLFPNESSFDRTHDYVFDETFLEEGMKFYIEVDGGDDYIERYENNNRYPASGWLDPNVIPVPTLEITFVPIGFNGGPAPDVTPASAMALLEDTLDLHPIAEVDIEIHDDINYNPEGNFQDWANNNPSDPGMLEVIRDLAWDEESDRAYAGIVPSDPSGSGIAGIGYVNCTGCSVWPYSVNIPSPSTVAHELGHNFGRNHVQCSGFEGGPDPSYPYAGGSIGTWGYEADTGDLKNPAVYNSFMSYCNTEWVSDYTYGAVLDFRNSAKGFDMVDVAADSSAVAFSGALDGHEASAFRIPDVGDPRSALDAAPTAARRIPALRGGDHQLVGLDAAGKVVTSAFFPVYVVADTAHLVEVRHFSFAVPVENSVLPSIVRWEIRDAAGLVTAVDAG